MKITELITILESKRKEFGDVQVKMGFDGFDYENDSHKFKIDDIDEIVLGNEYIYIT